MSEVIRLPVQSNDASQIPDRLLDQAEIAELLGVSKRWVQMHTQNGDLPHFRLGRYPRYRLDRVLAWLEKQERGGRRIT